MNNVLSLYEVNTHYGPSHVLQGINLRVDPSESVAILGRNGAGKTSTIHSIMSMVPVTSGTITFADTELTRLPSYRVSHQGIALVPQGRRLFPDLTVRENLLLAARPGVWDLDAVYSVFPRLHERAGHGAGQLSGGEQQMVAIGRALMTNPQLLLLDEPSEGLAPMIVKQIGGVIRKLKQEGLSILLVEQNIPLALGVADRVYVMSKGKIVFEGPPAVLAMDDELKQQHLGV